MIQHSEICRNLTQYLNRKTGKCVPCKLQPGHEVSPNCGRDDDGSIHESPFKPCEINFYNEGNSPYCKECTSCPIGNIESNCTPVTDTICRSFSTEVPNVIASQSNQITTIHPQIPSQFTVISMIFLSVIIALMLLLLAVVMINRKRKLGLSKRCRLRKFSSENINLASSDMSVDVEIGLNPIIYSAPLHTILDNLDILEELVILLDPEIQGVKNTRHLASLCSFPSTWITYAYSMKDTKSPLRAVLEGVTTKSPDRTVGYLANLLQEIERNDAIAILAKLRPSPTIHC